MKRKRKGEQFLVMWDQYGLEAIFSCSEWEKKHEEWSKSNIFSILKNQPHPPAPGIPLQHMILRAQANQRGYEIYTFGAQDGIQKKDVEDLFKNNPQFIVDFIRKNGSKVLSTRDTKKRVIE